MAKSLAQTDLAEKSLSYLRTQYRLLRSEGEMAFRIYTYGGLISMLGEAIISTPISNLVRTVTSDARDAAIGVITLAFSTDPIARWAYPDPSSYLESFPAFINAFAGAALEAGTAFGAEDLSGVAMWLLPDTHSDEEELGNIIERSTSGMLREELYELVEQMAMFHPTEPHWYLPMIGVDTRMQNRGIGESIMRYSLAKSDAAGLPAYLESSNPRNISLYERLGFKRIGRIQAGSSPEMIPMLREARQ